MPNKTQPQVDVGQLSLQGLGLFSPLLAAFSADDVNPVAMIQMERLGAAFPVNGQYASKVPDYLPRFTSTRLNWIGLLIGWRKDDAASYIVKMEIFNSPISVASSVQLRRVAKYLSSKHSVIGFGNILTANVGRVHSAYRHLQKPMPTDSLDVMTTESAVKLFQSISKALQTENTRARIYGTQSLSYILSQGKAKPFAFNKRSWSSSLSKDETSLPNIVWSLTADNHKGFDTAFENLTHCFRSLTPGCSCPNSYLSHGWGKLTRTAILKTDTCSYCKALWDAVGTALGHGAACFFAKADVNAIIPSPSYRRGINAMEIITEWRTLRIPPHPFHLEERFSDRGREDIKSILGISTSCTIYPNRLQIMALDLENGAYYEVVDGVLRFNGRNHNMLCSGPAAQRNEPEVFEPQYSTRDKIVPSSAGEHSELSLTLREVSNYLQLRCVVVVAKTNVPIDLEDVILSSYFVKQANPCEHPSSAPFKHGWINAITTSVAAPITTIPSWYAVALVLRNKPAQLLCCMSQRKILLQRDCCLTCALVQANKEGVSIVLTY
ncbi:hypothetical protein McanMca71_004234 [Microsporum canis]